MLNNIARMFLRTKFSFWIEYVLSRLFSFVYVVRTKRTAPLPKYETLKQIEEVLDRLIWSEDSFVVLGVKLKHFWMRSAEEIQWFLNNGMIPQTDCDEFAVYAAKALEGVEEANTPMVLTVRWTTPNGAVEGHNLAVYSYPTQNGLRMYGHIGNWGHFRGFNSIAKLVDSVGVQMAAPIISYALASPDLRFIASEKL